MKLTDLFDVLDPDTLVSIENAETDEVLCCCPLGQVTIDTIHPMKNWEVGAIFPEKYGKYYNRTGITIYIERAK